METRERAYWTCGACGTENQPEDEHCGGCDEWRTDQEEE